MTRPAHDLPGLDQAQETVTYEQPLNERMRTFLRLEFLFRQAQHHADGHGTWASRAAIGSLLDILSILGRGDVRQDAIKELERYSSDLIAFRARPGVDAGRLDALLDNIHQLRNGLTSNGSNLTQALKECDFLNAVKHRSAIPGGTCEFDLPDYNHWLSRPYEQRRGDFDNWMTHLTPLRDAVSRVLWLTRGSAQPSTETAQGGMYQHALTRGVSCQLLRVGLPLDSVLFPEISGSQHRFTVRFQAWANVDKRPTQTSDDVTFYLTCC